MRIFYPNKIIIIIGAIFLSGCAAQAPHLALDASLQKDIKTFNNTQYVPLIKLCDVYGLKWKWDPFARIATIEKNGTIILRPASNRILVNGSLKRLERPPVVNNGSVFVPISFVTENIGYIVEPGYYSAVSESRPAAVSGVDKRYVIRTIVIDPGHGGKDPGAIGKRLRLKEKNLTLALSKRLKSILENRGIKVVMTRESDTFIPLPRRAQIANDSDADLFVSVHFNSSRSKAMNGFECYYLSEATDDNARALAALENASLKLGEGTTIEHSNVLDKALWDMTLTENRRESAALAGHICGTVENNIAIRNRGTRTARFYVLKGSRMPAVLIEAGYLSNKVEEMKVQEPAYLDRMADALTSGILSYKEEYERTEGYTGI